MAKGFSLEIDPWSYRAKCQEDGSWIEEYVEKPHLSPPRRRLSRRTRGPIFS